MTKIQGIVTAPRDTPAVQPEDKEYRERGDYVQCSAVPLESYRSMFNRENHYQKQRPQFDPKKCQRQATVRIDGVPYCRAHAGQKALQILIEDGRLKNES